ncbi:MAG: hypothetical protein ACO1QS_00265 [Verrucomicrobiota bacterium]
MTRPAPSFYLVVFFFLLWGVYGLSRGLAEWADGKIYLPIDLICLFIGVGLLRRRSRWRSFAVVWLWLTVILEMLLFTWFIFSDQHATSNGAYPSWMPHPDIALSVLLALSCSASLWGLHVLNSPSVVSFFRASDTAQDRIA